jgi:hypothetical protein
MNVDFLLAPRFPQPFLDNLGGLGLLPWRTILWLTSVDKREAPMRDFWINEKSIVQLRFIAYACDDELVHAHAFFTRFPRCAVAQSVRRPSDKIALRTTHLHIEGGFPVCRLLSPPLAAITHITFNWFNQRLDGVALPLSLLSLTFGALFNQRLDGVVLPSSITHLTFCDDFDQPLHNVTLPASLTHLSFDGRFNQPLNNVALPASIVSLTLGCAFVDAFSSSSTFNQSLDGVTLPTSLKRLTFGSDFNRPLDNVALPSSLTHVTFGKWFNQGLDCLTRLPCLQSIGVAREYNRPVPPSIAHLVSASLS